MDDFDYSSRGYQASSSSGPSQNPSYNKSLQQSYDQQPNGRRHEEQDDSTPSNQYILRDSRGRTLALPKQNINSWTEEDQTNKRYH